MAAGSSITEAFRSGAEEALTKCLCGRRGGQMLRAPPCLGMKPRRKFGQLGLSSWRFFLQSVANIRQTRAITDSHKVAFSRSLRALSPFFDLSPGEQHQRVWRGVLRCACLSHARVSFHSAALLAKRLRESVREPPREISHLSRSPFFGL